MKSFVVTFFVTALTFSVSAFANVDAYGVLGVSPQASEEQLVKAWRLLARKYMPLVNAGDGLASNKMKEINAAWNLVKSPEKRAAYDLQSGSRSQSGASGPTFKDTNVDEVLEKHPEWSPFLSDYDRGVQELIGKEDWTTLLEIYEAVVDDNFSRAVFRRLAELEDSHRLRRVLTQILDIEVKYSPRGHLWNIPSISTYFFSQKKFADLTIALLPKYFRHADRYGLRSVAGDFFARADSLPLGDRYLWEIVRKTRKEEDKGTLYMMAEWVFRDSEAGERRDPELVVAMVKESDDVMAERILAWRYKLAWGGRGMQAIIERGDSDALKGLRQRLSSSSFRAKKWDIYREALKLPDAQAGEFLRQHLGELKLREPKPVLMDCASHLAGQSLTLTDESEN